MNGRYITIKVKDHPFLPDGYMFEHRYKMANKLGRKLKRSEVVHHKNGKPKDNRLSNLQLFNSNGERMTHELTGRKRKPFSAENRENLRKAGLGQKRAVGKRSDESKERMRQAQLKYHQRMKDEGTVRPVDIQPRNGGQWA